MLDIKDCSDFNDLHLACGLDVVRQQINAAIGISISTVINSSTEAANESPAPSEACENQIALPVIEKDFDGRYTVATLLENFAYVYNTDMCWDSITKELMKLAHLRHLVGREKFKYWDEHRDRKTIQELRFEPGNELSSEYVNLFEGFALDPNPKGEEGCKKIINHVWRLCNFREEEYKWLMKWIAFPFQNPGAKMDSSVVMYGSEGPGKSIMFDSVLGKIYGRHAITIGQAQLESSFTDWQSRRLFAVAEEVVSRSERNHHKGMLKHLVTGSSLQIDQKHMALREETNHINFVFLSNSSVPLELDIGDRRYLVLYVDAVPPAEYFKELFEEIDNGGVEAFYHYLLNLNLGDFDERTKPPFNEEKDKLISASMPSPQYFHKLWAAGELDIPYTAAKADDLYRYFQKWCEANGEFRRTSRFFGQELQRVMKQERVNIRYPKYASDRKTCRVYVPDVALESEVDGSRNDIVGEQARKFLEKLDRRDLSEGNS